MKGDYTCDFYSYPKLAKKESSCWWQVKSMYPPGSGLHHRRRPRVILISNYSYPETSKYCSKLLSIINEITPCKITIFKGKKYIRFELLKTYDQSLILLNFIRNLWYEPFTGYSEKFFKSLYKSKYKDPMRTLTWANLKACEKMQCPYGSYGHCNAHKGLKLRTTKQLLEYEGENTYVFLTTEN